MNVKMPQSEEEETALLSEAFMQIVAVLTSKFVRRVNNRRNTHATANAQLDRPDGTPHGDL